MLNWLWRRVFSEKNIEYLVEKAEPVIQERISEMAKDAFFEVLHDEETLAQITGLGDALYDRYSKKLWGSIGGKQKGINYAMDRVNPLNQILDEDGNPSLSGIIKAALSGGLGFGKEGQTTGGLSQSRRKVLKYQ